MGDDKGQCELCHVRCLRLEPAPDRRRVPEYVRPLVHRGSMSGLVSVFKVINIQILQTVLSILALGFEDDLCILYMQ